MNCRVELSKKVRKGLALLPKHVIANLLDWVVEVEERGLEDVRKLPGYHDEPLKGSWIGYRSIRLNRSYRAIYRAKDMDVRIVSVVEVNKHEY